MPDVPSKSLFRNIVPPMRRESNKRSKVVTPRVSCANKAENRQLSAYMEVELNLENDDVMHGKESPGNSPSSPQVSFKSNLSDGSALSSPHFIGLEDQEGIPERLCAEMYRTTYESMSQGLNLQISTIRPPPRDKLMTSSIAKELSVKQNDQTLNDIASDRIDNDISPRRTIAERRRDSPFEGHCASMEHNSSSMYRDIEYIETIPPSSVTSSDSQDHILNSSTSSKEEKDSDIKIVVHPKNHSHGPGTRIIYEIEEAHVPSNAEVNEELIRDRQKALRLEQERDAQYASTVQLNTGEFFERQKQYYFEKRKKSEAEYLEWCRKRAQAIAQEKRRTEQENEIFRKRFEEIQLAIEEEKNRSLFDAMETRKKYAKELREQVMNNVKREKQQQQKEEETYSTLPLVMRDMQSSIDYQNEIRQEYRTFLQDQVKEKELRMRIQREMDKEQFNDKAREELEELQRDNEIAKKREEETRRNMREEWMKSLQMIDKEKEAAVQAAKNAQRKMQKSEEKRREYHHMALQSRVQSILNRKSELGEQLQYLEALKRQESKRDEKEVQEAERLWDNLNTIRKKLYRRNNRILPPNQFSSTHNDMFKQTYSILPSAATRCVNIV